MSSTLRAPRTRGAFSGVMLVLLGLWGGLVPFVGPYWDFAYTPDSTWTTTSGRWYLEVVPAAAVVLGGLIALGGRNRLAGAFGALLAAAGGAWFAVGGPLSTLWTADGADAAGSPVGNSTRQVVEQLTFFTGLGVVVVFFAALALGRFAVAGRIAEPRPVEPVEAEGPYREASMSRPMPPASDPDEYRPQYSRTGVPSDQRVAGPPEEG